MKCKLAEKLLPAYIEGTLSPKRSQQLELHIDDCPHCQKELQAFEVILHHASSLRVEYPTPEAWRAFWPALRMRMSQDHGFEENRLLLWLRIHGWQMAGAACVLVLVLSFWAFSDSRLFKPSADSPTLDVLISPSFIADIPVEQLREQLNRELQTLDVPSVWDSQGTLMDEVRLPNSTASADLVNQWFNIINSEIAIESSGDEVLTDFVPLVTDQIALTTLD